jgi:hypothetical protein
MEVIDEGHTYRLDNLKNKEKTIIQFYKDPKLNDGYEQNGPSCQEYLRAIIDRVKFLDNQKYWEGNAEIIDYLRKAIALFEARALLRKVEKGLEVEKLAVDSDGHLVLKDA